MTLLLLAMLCQTSWHVSSYLVTQCQALLRQWHDARCIRWRELGPAQAGWDPAKPQALLLCWAPAALAAHRCQGLAHRP